MTPPLIDVARTGPDKFASDFNREPFAVVHGLSELPAFRMSALRDLVSRWPKNTDYFVAAGAKAAGAAFYEGERPPETPLEAFDKLETGSYRILLKRLERHDPGFRELLNSLFAELLAVRPDFRTHRVIRLESFMFISSASTITPFHFDPEVAFFFQIAGEKFYHLYSPTTVTEVELENYYLRGVIDVGQIDLESRKRHQETLFQLGPGRGLHQPPHSPHWVETRGSLSISYSFAIETDQTRSTGTVWASNGLIRRLGIAPTRPGRSPAMDRIKALSMQVGRPLVRAAQSMRG